MKNERLSPARGTDTLDLDTKHWLNQFIPENVSDRTAIPQYPRVHQRSIVCPSCNGVQIVQGHRDGLSLVGQILEQLECLE